MRFAAASRQLRMTDSELHEWSRERLSYDVEMVLFVSYALTTLPSLKTMRALVVRNALLDSFAIHVRALIAFFYDKKQHPDDVVADDFVADSDAWYTARPPLTETLSDARRRTHKEVAHLTEIGLGGGPPPQPWHPTILIGDLKPVIKAFTECALSTRLDAKIGALLRFHDTPGLMALFDVPGQRGGA